MHERGTKTLSRYIKNRYNYKLKSDKKMRKTILTFTMMLMMTFTAAAGPVIKATPASKNAAAGKTQVEFKGDSIVVNDGDESVVVSGLPELQKVRDKINEALDDTLTAGDGTTVEIEGYKGELSPEDIKYMSDHWGEVAKQIAYASILGLLGLVLLVLLFRYLNRVRRYNVIEKAIVNNYPLDNLSLNDAKHSAIYVQQPVVTAAPQRPGQVPVGTPIKGQTPDNPIVMTNMINWRALMPAIRVFAFGLFFCLFGFFVAGGDDPFTYLGLALMFVGACKGFILYKEQQSLQEAMHRAQEQMPPKEPMREGIPVPPPLDNDYREDDDTPFQPY